MRNPHVTQANPLAQLEVCTFRSRRPSRTCTLEEKGSSFGSTNSLSHHEMAVGDYYLKLGSFSVSVSGRPGSLYIRVPRTSLTPRDEISGKKDPSVMADLGMRVWINRSVSSCAEYVERIALR